MIFNYLKSNDFVDEDIFNQIYPQRIRKLSKRHWSPIWVSKLAASFLGENQDAKILDIGSGVGKFCMIGAAVTSASFTGVEQRGDLVKISNRISNHYKLENAKFIHANITSIDFNRFDAFYFFNSFFENIDTDGRIDDRLTLNKEFYELYSGHVLLQLSNQKPGTRLVTYHSSWSVVPGNYALVSSTDDGLLKLWEKTDQ
jgi:hypothetical protein